MHKPQTHKKKLQRVLRTHQNMTVSWHPKLQKFDVPYNQNAKNVAVFI
jgi:hypothetical protein